MSQYWNKLMANFNFMAIVLVAKHHSAYYIRYHIK